jgi:ATP-dependent Clp endopeptidase proteolytic subunit ClpP
MQPVYDYYVPYVTENTPRGERQSDLFSRLLREHIIILGTPIDDTIANLVCAQLLYLQYENADRDINLYINSPGGDITALFAIYDTMQLVKNPIATWCYGQAASAAAVLLSAGADVFAGAAVAAAGSDTAVCVRQAFDGSDCGGDLARIEQRGSCGRFDL